MGRCGGRGRAHHKHPCNSENPFDMSIFSWHSRAYSIHSFAQLSWHSTGETNLSTGRSRIPSFLTPCSTQSFLFKQLQEWALDGKMVDHVESWIPIFLIRFSFQRFFAKTCKNKLWMGRCGERSKFPTVHTHTRLIPSTLLKFQSFHVSRAYSIYSFAQLSWHGTGGNDLWMVDLGFLLFSCPFPFTALYSKTCNYELWMVRSRIPSFLIPFPFQSFLLRQLQESTLVVDLGFLLFSCPFPFTVFYSKPTSMNFGW